MQQFEYKIIPAPSKGRKGSGIKGAEARFAFGLETAINEWAAEGWDYLRADILPSEERQGLTSTQTTYRSVLVFRRQVAPPSAQDTVGAAQVPMQTDRPQTPPPEPAHSDHDIPATTPEPASQGEQTTYDYQDELTETPQGNPR